MLADFLPFFPERLRFAVASMVLPTLLSSFCSRCRRFLWSNLFGSSSTLAIIIFISRSDHHPFVAKPAPKLEALQQVQE